MGFRMGFVLNFANLRAEVEVIDPSDLVAESEFDAVIDIDFFRSQEVGQITSDEVQCLIFMICELQAKQKLGW